MMARKHTRSDLLIIARNLLRELADDYHAGRIEHFKTPGRTYRARKPALHGFTLMRLANFAGCSKEDLYYHWHSKDALIFDVVDDACNAVERDVHAAKTLLEVGIAASTLTDRAPALLFDGDAVVDPATRYRFNRCVGRIRARARACIIKQHGARAAVLAEGIALMLASACTATTCHEDRTAVIWQAVKLGSDTLIGQHMPVEPRRKAHN